MNLPIVPDGSGTVPGAPGVTEERLLGWLMAYRLNQAGRLLVPNVVLQAWRARGWTSPPANVEVITPTGLALTDLLAAEYGTNFLPPSPTPPPPAPEDLPR